MSCTSTLGDAGRMHFSPDYYVGYRGWHFTADSPGERSGGLAELATIAGAVLTPACWLFGWLMAFC
jgi:hypothetical protein